LALAADRINRQATQKLDHLAQILDLSEEQRDQIFRLNSGFATLKPGI
jgi:hypothetical protein